MSEEIDVVPLLVPANGTPAVIDSEAAFKSAIIMVAVVRVIHLDGKLI